MHIVFRRARFQPSRLLLLVGLALMVLLGTRASSWLLSDVASFKPHASPSLQVADLYGMLPLSFEANLEQSDPQVNFLSRGPGYTLFLTPSEAVLALRQASPSSKGKEPAASATTVLRMGLVGANPTPEVAGAGQLPGVSNYFIGNDPAQWRTGVPTYRQAVYRQVYPGIDLLYYGSSQGQLEYDFVVAPEADPGAITLAFEGAERLTLDRRGDLVLHVSGGTVVQHRPKVYQEVDGARVTVPGRYVLKGQGQVGFRVGPYDRSRPLVIDPVLSYSTYLGGNNNDEGLGIAVDTGGNVYVAGGAASTDFPTATPFQGTNAGSFDVFVAKLNPTGSALVFATYLGGSGRDRAFGIAVDSQGNVLLAGDASSSDFPMVNAFKPQHSGVNTEEGFVAKLNSSGSAMIYSTYLGGGGIGFPFGVVVDASGNAYVTGRTTSTDFPTTSNAFQLQHGQAFPGNYDAFLTKLSPSGGLLYSSYLGGTSDDQGRGIALDTSGNVYVVGFTKSVDAPGTLDKDEGFPLVNPLQGTFGGTWDAFVTKWSPSGQVLYSTYLGGSTTDEGLAIAADAAGNTYVTGRTDSLDFLTAGNAFQQANGGNNNEDAFIVKLSPTGATRVYSTYLGGVGDDQGRGITVDASGNAYVTGKGEPGFPIVNPIPQASSGGAGHAFVSKLNSTGSLLSFSTLLGIGGGAGEQGNAITVDTAGVIYVTGAVAFNGSIPTVNALQSTKGALNDAFVAKISPDPTPTPTPTPTATATPTKTPTPSPTPTLVPGVGIPGLVTMALGLAGLAYIALRRWRPQNT